MSLAVILLAAFAAEHAERYLPIDLDRLPLSARARLGSARYDAGDQLSAMASSLSTDGMRVALLPDFFRRRGGPGINIYDAETGKLLRTIRPSTKEGWQIQWVRFVSPTKLLAGDSNNDFALYIIDTETGHTETILSEMKHSGSWAGVSDDAGLMIEKTKPLEFIVWQTRPLKKLQVIRPVLQKRDAPGKEPADVWSVLSGNGSTFLTVEYTEDRFGKIWDRFAQIWDTKTGKERIRIEIGHHAGQLALSADGTRLAVGMNWCIRVFDTKTGKTVLSVPTETTDEDRIQFDHEGTRLLLITRYEFQVFSATTGKRLKCTPIPPSDNYRELSECQIAFTKGGLARIFCKREPWMGVWDVEAGRPLGPCAGHGTVIRALRFSTDGKQLISTDREWPGGRELTWNLTKLDAVEPYPNAVKLGGRSGYEWFGAWSSPNGDILFAQRAVRREDATLVAFDSTSVKERYRVRLPESLKELQGLVFSRDSKTFTFSGNVGDAELKLPVFETATGKIACTVKLDKVCDFYYPSFSPDGSRLAFRTRTQIEGDKDKLELLVFETKSGKQLVRRELAFNVYQVWLLADNKTALYMCGQKQLSLETRDIATGKLLRVHQREDQMHELGIPGEMQSGGVLSDDGKLFGFVTDGRDSQFRAMTTIVVIDTDAMTESIEFRGPPPSTVGFNVGPYEYPRALAFSTDKRTLAAGLNNGTILLYDIPSAKKLKPR